MSILKTTQRLIGLLVLIMLVLSGCNFSSGTALTATPTDEAREELITMRVTVQVSLDVARVLHQQAPPTTESQELLQIVEELGVVLEPIHPGAEDPLLAPYFTVEVPDLATAERVIARLQQSEAVEAAYLKPPDELP